MLAHGLSGVLSKLVSPLQGAFFLNRNIHDNILIIYEKTFSILKEKEKELCYMTAKLDMEKRLITIYNGILLRNVFRTLVFRTND